MAIVCNALMGVTKDACGAVSAVNFAILNWPLPGIAPNKAVYFKDVCEQSQEQRLTLLVGDDEEVELVWPGDTNASVYAYLKTVANVTIHVTGPLKGESSKVIAHTVPLRAFAKFEEALMADTHVFG